MASPSGHSNAAIAGAILAGGESRRMAVPKPNLLLNGKTLTEHTIGCISPQVAALAVCAGANQDGFTTFDYPILPDPSTARLGPMSGILTALNWAKSEGFEASLVVPCDMPFLPSDLVQRLNATRAPNQPTFARSARGGHYCVAIWPVSVVGELEFLFNEGERAVRSALNHFKSTECVFEDDRNAFLDVNTPEDYQQAEQFLAQRTP